jgi:hypothetical protein
MQTADSSVSLSSHLLHNNTLNLSRSAACVMCGIVVTKADIFPLVATKAASQVIINVAYPCLLFSKIVPAYLTGDNIRALGKY